MIAVQMQCISRKNSTHTDRSPKKGQVRKFSSIIFNQKVRKSSSQVKSIQFEVQFILGHTVKVIACFLRDEVHDAMLQGPCQKEGHQTDLDLLQISKRIVQFHLEQLAQGRGTEMEDSIFIAAYSALSRKMDGHPLDNVAFN